MKALPLLVAGAAVLVALAPVVACSASAASPGGPEGTSPEAGATPDATSEAGAQPADGGGSGRNEDASKPDAATDPLASDPKSCGAVGHDCGGASCTSGRCAPQTVRTASSGDIIRFLSLDETGALVTLVDVSGKTRADVRRGPVDGVDTTLFTVPASAETHSLFYAGALLADGNGAIERYTGSGGAPANLLVIDASGDSLARQGTLLFYADPSGSNVYETDASGGGKTPFGDPATGKKLAVAVDATDVYAANAGNGAGGGSSIYRIPRAGGATVNLGVTGITDRFTEALDVTSTRIVGTALTYDGTSCPGATRTIWSAPLAGGAATTLAPQSANVAFQLVAGDHVYWIDRTCPPSTAPDRIYRRRADGTDAPLVLVEATNGTLEHATAADGAYLYFTDGTAVRRVAR